MKAQEWTFIDKSEWPMQGPWNDEPNKAQWTDEATGLPCLIHRGPFGALCGYVGVPDTHPWHSKGYSDCVNPVLHENHEGGEDDWHYSCTPCGMVEVHGGLTYAAACAESTREDGGGICHIPGEGEPDNVWWFGFDCAHSGDLSPKYDDSHGAYCSRGYVERECSRLAEQLSRVAK